MTIPEAQLAILKVAGFRHEELVIDTALIEKVLQSNSSAEENGTVLEVANGRVKVTMKGGGVSVELPVVIPVEDLKTAMADVRILRMVRYIDKRLCDDRSGEFEKSMRDFLDNERDAKTAPPKAEPQKPVPAVEPKPAKADKSGFTAKLGDKYEAKVVETPAAPPVAPKPATAKAALAMSAEQRQALADADKARREADRAAAAAKADKPEPKKGLAALASLKAGK